MRVRTRKRALWWATHPLERRPFRRRSVGFDQTLVGMGRHESRAPLSRGYGGKVQLGARLLVRCGCWGWALVATSVGACSPDSASSTPSGGDRAGGAGSAHAGQSTSEGGATALSGGASSANDVGGTDNAGSPALGGAGSPATNAGNGGIAGTAGATLNDYCSTRAGLAFWLRKVRRTRDRRLVRRHCDQHRARRL